MSSDQPNVWAALDAFLESERSPLDCMQMSELDGLLTAVVICPEIIPADEWTAIIWDGQQPVFADEAERTAVLGGITGRYNEIVSSIDDGTYTPIFWEETDGTVVPFNWAEGFLIGTGLREKIWQPFLKSDAASQSLFPILALGSEEISEEMAADDLESLLADCETAVPASVMEIARYWRDGPRKPIRRPEPKQGRNDACACGSGRKFKKCCGAAV